MKRERLTEDGTFGKYCSMFLENSCFLFKTGAALCCSANNVKRIHVVILYGKSGYN